MRWTSWGRKATVAVFMGALLAPLIAVGFSNHVRETVAVVAGNPGEWQAQSNRLRAATPLWDNAVSAYSTLLYDLGTSSNEGVGVVGRDGWMFLGDVQNANFSQAIGRRQYTQQEIDAWASVVDDQREWLAARGIPMVFAVGPAKWSVYPDQLPAWTDDVREETIFDQILAARPDLGVVDLRPGLREARDTADTYSKLNSHWTDYGAYVGWQGIADAIEQRLPGVDAHASALESVTTSDDGPNEFDAMMGVRAPNPWTTPELAQPLPDYQVPQGDGTAVTLSGDQVTNLLDLPRTTTNPDAGNDLTVLVLRDSMGDALSPYIQAAFGTTVQVRHNIDSPQEAPNLAAMVDLVQPDLVLVEMAERHFNSGLPDGEAWAAANAYDRADAGAGSSWTSSDPAAATLSVEGALGTGTSSTVRWDAPTAGTAVLRVSLLASGPGTMTVRADDGTARSLRVARDSNVLFAEIPVAAGAQSVTLELGAGSAAAELTSLSVRPAS